MKRREIFLIAIVVILILLIIGALLLKNNSSKNKMNSSNNISNNISITQYETGKPFVLNKIIIDSDSDIEELGKYVEKLKPLNASESVDLALAQEIDIKYNDYISIGIQLGEKNYCYYTSH